MLQSEPRGSLCAVAFTAIEADLEAFSPASWSGSGSRDTTDGDDGHGRLAVRKASELFFKRS